jgi:hypothetical protein
MERGSIFYHLLYIYTFPVSLFSFLEPREKITKIDVDCPPSSKATVTTILRGPTIKTPGKDYLAIPYGEQRRYPDQFSG